MHSTAKIPGHTHAPQTIRRGTSLHAFGTILQGGRRTVGLVAEDGDDLMLGLQAHLHHSLPFTLKLVLLVLQHVQALPRNTELQKGQSGAEHSLGLLPRDRRGRSDLVGHHRKGSTDEARSWHLLRHRDCENYKRGSGLAAAFTC